MALAYKWCPDTDARGPSDPSHPANRPRSWVESDLEFAGFIAFTCQIRSDSGTVLQALARDPALWAQTY